MLAAYVAMGHEIDVMHYHFDHESALPDALAGSVHRYIEVPLKGHRVLRHVSLDPPVAREYGLAATASQPQLDRYDVVQAETSSIWRIARRAIGTRRLLVLHDDDAERLRSLTKVTDRSALRVIWRVSALQYGQLQRVAIAGADRIWFVSASDRDRLAGPQSGKTRVVPNGASDELWTVPAVDADGAPEVLYVGARSYEANRYALRWFLARVWPTIRARSPQAHMTVVGSGWRGAGDRIGVEFVGWRPSLRGDYERSRVVIAPVFARGGTNVKVVEGMAAARPVVTTTMGAQGIPAAEGRFAEDDPTRFAERVIELLDVPLVAAQAGVANRRRVDHLRWSLIWRDAGNDLHHLVSGARHRESV